jgi:hypothetical protein
VFAAVAALFVLIFGAAFAFSSLRVIIDAAAAEPSTQTLGRSVSSVVQGTLSSPLIRRLKLRDVRILRSNDPGGWNGSLFLDTVRSRESARTGAVSLEAKGSLNGQAFRLSGTVPDLSPAAGRARGGDTSLKSNGSSPAAPTAARPWSASSPASTSRTGSEPPAS